MKKEILEALKLKFTGVSESVLDRIATKLAKTVTTAEQVKTAVDGVTIQQVIESYTDSRVSEAQQTSVQNYEKKYNLKDGKPVVIPNPNPKGQEPTEPKPQSQQQQQGDGTPSWAQALLESNKQLTDRLNALESQRTTETRRQKLSEVTKKLPENLRKPYSRINLESLSEDEFNTLVTDVTGEVDGIVSSLRTKGAVFGHPKTHAEGTQQQGGEALSEQQIAAINKRDVQPAKDAQPF